MVWPTGGIKGAELAIEVVVPLPSLVLGIAVDDDLVVDDDLGRRWALDNIGSSSPSQDPNLPSQLFCLLLGSLRVWHPLVGWSPADLEAGIWHALPRTVLKKSCQE